MAVKKNVQLSDFSNNQLLPKIDIIDTETTTTSTTAPLSARRTMQEIKSVKDAAVWKTDKDTGGGVAGLDYYKQISLSALPELMKYEYCNIVAFDGFTNEDFSSQLDDKKYFYHGYSPYISSKLLYFHRLLKVFIVEEISGNQVTYIFKDTELTKNPCVLYLSSTSKILYKFDGNDLVPLLTKESVELGNVDNTSDKNKPISTAQATAIADAKKAGTDAQSQVASLESTLKAQIKDLQDKVAALTTKVQSVTPSSTQTLVTANK